MMTVPQEPGTLYWKRPRRLDAARFHAFALDVERIAECSPYGVDLAADKNPQTRGLVFLNGCCRPHQGEVFVISRDLCDSGILARSASDILIESCRHRGLPYGIVARAALIAFKRHFENEVTVIYDGDHKAWGKAWDLCSEAFRGRELSREEYENFQTMAALGGDITRSPYLEDLRRSA